MAELGEASAPTPQELGVTHGPDTNMRQEWGQINPDVAPEVLDAVEPPSSERVTKFGEAAKRKLAGIALRAYDKAHGMDAHRSYEVVRRMEFMHDLGVEPAFADEVEAMDAEPIVEESVKIVKKPEKILKTQAYLKRVDETGDDSLIRAVFAKEVRPGVFETVDGVRMPPADVRDAREKFGEPGSPTYELVKKYVAGQSETDSLIAAQNAEANAVLDKAEIASDPSNLKYVNKPIDLQPK